MQLTRPRPILLAVPALLLVLVLVACASPPPTALPATSTTSGIITLTAPSTTTPPTTTPPPPSTTVPSTTTASTTTTSAPLTTAPSLTAAPATSAAPAPIGQIAAAAAPVVLSRGHVDLIEVTREGSSLRISVKDETSGSPVFRRTDEVQLRVPDAARIRVPGGPFGFLGPTGSEVFVLPQVQDPDLVWPGWSTERMAAGQVAGDAVRLRLAQVRGPGKVAVFTTDQFGVPAVLFDSAGPPRREVVLPIRTHAHANWAFGAPGVYRLTVEVSAGLVGAGPATATATATYVVLVGDATAPVVDGSVTPPGESPSTAPVDGAAARAAAGSGPPAEVAGTAATAGSTGASTAAGSASLARTGATSGWAAGLGAVLVLSGSAVLSASRRERRRASAATSR